jgi:hypothetical protein
MDDAEMPDSDKDELKPKGKQKTSQIKMILRHSQ